MSYFYDAFNDYWLKSKKRVPDGEGGFFTVWENSGKVKMSLDLGSSSEIRQAQAQKLDTVWTAVFPENTPVQYNDYLEDVETGDVYRVTSDPKDNKTPKEATFHSWYATAVRTELPTV